MAINVVRFQKNQEISWGILAGDHIAPIEGSYATTRSFMLEGAARARSMDVDPTVGLKRSEVEILCPVTRDRQFICQAINYHSHLRESRMDAKSSPFNIFFRKASSCMVHGDSDVVSPAHVEFLDYEVELGLVLSCDVSGPIQVSNDNLHEYVGALVIVNDISARDIQLPEMQFYKGKSYRTFGPIGPHLTLVDRDDLQRFEQLRLQLSVNGEPRQNSLTTDMVHRPPSTLTELSGLQDWEAGDLIATGTPGGVAMQAPPTPIKMIAQAVSPLRRQGMLRGVAKKNPRRLKIGDRIEATIGTDDDSIQLGTQHNTIIGA